MAVVTGWVDEERPPPHREAEGGGQGMALDPHLETSCGLCQMPGRCSQGEGGLQGKVRPLPLPGFQWVRESQGVGKAS